MVKFTKMGNLPKEINFKLRMKLWDLLSFKVIAEVVEQSD